MRALRVDKTRFPFAGVRTGTEWPLTAELDDSATPPRSTIIAGDPGTGDARQSVDDAIEDLRARLESDGPLTREQMGAMNGNAKRAYDAMRHTGELVECGKVGRTQLYRLADDVEPMDLGLERGQAPDHAPDHARSKALQRKGSSVVNPRPRTDREGKTGHDEVNASPSVDSSSMPPTSDEANERGQGQVYIGTTDHDHVRAIASEPVGEPEFEDVL